MVSFPDAWNILFFCLRISFFPTSTKYFCCSNSVFNIKTFRKSKATEKEKRKSFYIPLICSLSKWQVTWMPADHDVTLMPRWTATLQLLGPIRVSVAWPGRGESNHLFEQENRAYDPGSGESAVLRGPRLGVWRGRP